MLISVKLLTKYVIIIYVLGSAHEKFGVWTNQPGLTFLTGVHLFKNRSQMTSWCTKNENSGTRAAGECVHWCSYHILTSTVIYYWTDPKIRTGGSVYLIVIYFWNSKTISQLNFERLLVTDFCSNDFFWFFFGIFIMSMKADTRNFNKKYHQNFLLDPIFFEH